MNTEPDSQQFTSNPEFENKPEFENRLPEISMQPSATNAIASPGYPEPSDFEAASTNAEKSTENPPIAKNALTPLTDSSEPANPVASATTPVPLKSTAPELEPTVRLVIAGVRPGRGTVKVAIFTDASTFPNPINASQAFELATTNPTIETTVPSTKRFAVAVYQDLNLDGELNRNRTGIPSEPFAFSNNAMGKRGPPSFEEAAVVRPAESGGGSNEPLVVSIQLP